MSVEPYLTTGLDCHLADVVIPDRATGENVQDNKESAQTKLKLSVLAVGNKDFICKEVKKQMEYVAENVEYQELNFGRRVSGAISEDLLGLLATVGMKGKGFCENMPDGLCFEGDR